MTDSTKVLTVPNIRCQTVLPGDGWSPVTPREEFAVFGNTTRQWITAIDKWTEYMRAGGARPHTLKLRRYQISRLAQDHLHRSPWKITGEELAAWLGSHTWSSETLRSYRSALASFYRWAAQVARTIRKDPAVALPKIRQRRGVPRPTPNKVYLEALGRASDRDRLILMLAAHAGLRRGEIAALQWSDVDTDTGVIRIVGKGGQIRLVPMADALGGELERERARRTAGRYGSGYRYTATVDQAWVFPGQSGGHMTPGRIGKVAARLLGPGWSCHTLRHRFATRAYAGTRDLLAVQELLGHASPETSRRYTQVPDGALTAAVHAAA